MAWGTPQWGVGAPGGSPTAFTRQPNTDAQPVLTRRTARRDFGQVTGKDGLILRWGGGERGGLTHAEYLTVVDAWKTHAKPNAGRVSLRRYNEETDAWENVKAIMLRPQGRPRGGDTNGPRWFDVTIEFRAIGIP